jgi:CheY-like chemotaxis protein/anti-sigma regulatory factor (Ser/Thr protein kinase)
VSGDQTRIEQIVSNLLVNAATYSPPGHAIRVALTGENGDAVLQVSDEGIGIAAANQPRIFDLFYQVEPSGSRAHGGLGIGLTLVKRLVELHGGSVSVASAGEGRGATFTVRLPALAAGAGSASAEPGAIEPRTVLIVEDNDDERESLRLALEQHGHRVLHAGDARSALAEIRSGRPSVALIDIGLPGMDGYALARAIRSQHDGTLALVALTGYGAPADVDRAREAGFALHLTKPVEANQLAAIVSRAVS